MKRPATDRLKLNPPLGRMPVLQFCPPAELEVDPSYQRSLEAAASKALIARIAQHWNWDLCQPLHVSRRNDGRLFVIDGQHRLEAARRRGDIAQIPCVVVGYPSPADEAASFVHLNQQRRPLGALDLFKAALASGDTFATELAARMAVAGLSLAPHTNPTAWQPGMVGNIAGLKRAWAERGPDIAGRAMDALSLGFPDQQQQYAGTIFPGLVAVCADEMQTRQGFKGDRWASFITLLRSRSQAEWRSAILREAAKSPGLFTANAAAQALRAAWAEPTSGASPAPLAKPITLAAPQRASVPAFDAQGKAWCTQCESRVSTNTARNCRSRFCSLRAQTSVQ